MVICANLARRPDRRFFVERMFPVIGGERMEFLDAVDGEGVSETKLARFPQGTTVSNYAVRLTKQLVLRKFLRSRTDYLLFLEDDVFLTAEFEDTLARAIKTDSDLVFLGANHAEPPAEDGDWSRCRYPFANHAVLFSRMGASKVRKMLLEWNAPQSDVEIAQNIRLGKLLALSPRKHVAFQRKALSDNSGDPGSYDLSQGFQMDLSADDLAVLSAALVGCHDVVEWGSGGSTAFIGKQIGSGGRLISVEHNPYWSKQTQATLDAHEINNVELLLTPPRANREIEPYGRFSKRELQDYIHAPGKLMGGSQVDLVLVDGRQRIECALTAAEWLKPGGFLLVHDFWCRDRYRARLPELLREYEYVLESPHRGAIHGMALFRRK